MVQCNNCIVCMYTLSSNFNHTGITNPLQFRYHESKPKLKLSFSSFPTSKLMYWWIMYYTALPYSNWIIHKSICDSIQFAAFPHLCRKPYTYSRMSNIFSKMLLNYLFTCTELVVMMMMSTVWELHIVYFILIWEKFWCNISVYLKRLLCLHFNNETNLNRFKTNDAVSVWIYVSCV